MTRWFRFYEDAVNDPKVQRLPGDKFKAWVNLLCIASRNNGVLPAIDDVAFVLRVTRDELSDLLNEFCDAGLLDPVEVRDAPMSYEPHNWKERQYISDIKDPTAKKRSKNYRKRKRDAAYRKRDETVSVTATRADTEADTEQSKKETRVTALSPEWRLWFDTFWQEWPNKVGKPAALKALISAAKRGADLDAIIAGVQRYIREKPPDRPWLNPATFLNQNRWEDQPAQVENGKTSSVSAACDNLVQLVNAGFGGAPSQDRSGGTANETDARLLSYRGGK